MACVKLFESTHKGGISENVGNHPNAYFNSSHEYFKSKQKKASQVPPVASKEEPAIGKPTEMPSEMPTEKPEDKMDIEEN